MRRGRILIIVLLILIIFIAIAAFLLRSVLSGGGLLAQQSPTPAMAEVVIAGQNIPQGGVISAEMLGYIYLPQDKVAAVMYTRSQESELIGKVARFSLDQGVVITRSMVAETAADLAEGGPEWARVIPPGLTAISIPITRLAAVSYGVTEGAHVNVNACMLVLDVDTAYQSALPNHLSVLLGPNGDTVDKMSAITLSEATGGDPWYQGRIEVEASFRQPWHIIPSEAQRPRLVCQMIQQDVVVLRLGDFEEEKTTQIEQPTPPPQSTEQTTPEQRPPDVITLIVTPQDSVTLTYMLYSGAKLNLTLRNATDQSRVATEAATLQFILSQYNIPVPAKLPYASEPRINALVDPYMPNDIVVVPAE